MSTSEDQMAAVQPHAHAARSGTATARYARKKRDILAAATDILNRDGVKGMTLARVAARVGLITTSVTYYFKKKETLAVACFLDSIERFDALVSEALRAPHPRARLKRLLESYLDLRRRIALGEAPPIAALYDVRALQNPERDQVLAACARLFDKLHGLFVAPELEWMDGRTRAARVHLLRQQVFSAMAWLPRYDIEDYDRLGERMYDILANGLGLEERPWQAPALAIAELAPTEMSPRETFLIAATRLINERGYRGASVEKISARLNVTKGSFYHHNEAKDDLILECFKRSADTIRRVQAAIAELPGDHWNRLAAAASTLVNYQLSERGPLLRSSALPALPEAIRNQTVDEANHINDRFGALIADGIAEGSMRPVDPFIAAQLFDAMLTAAAECPTWIPDVSREEAVTLHVKPMLKGIFAE